MNNALKVTEALTDWAMEVAESVLPKVSIPADSAIGNVMRFMGVDVASYSIYKELGFLIEPTIKRAIEPTITKYLSTMSDEDIKELVMSYADALIEQANAKGYVNIFGVELGRNAFVGLKEILTDKLN